MADEYSDVRTARVLKSKMRRIQYQFVLHSYSYSIGYYRIIPIRNHANESSKCTSGTLRKILATSDEYSNVRTAHGFSLKMWRLQCYFALQSYLHSNGYYWTILIRNHANENSKYFSGVLRKILATSDWDSNVGTGLNSVNRRLQCYLTSQSEINFKELLQNHPDYQVLNTFSACKDSYSMHQMHILTWEWVLKHVAKYASI
jgi:hypothetical protein